MGLGCDRELVDGEEVIPSPCMGWLFLSLVCLDFGGVLWGLNPVVRHLEPKFEIFHFCFALVVFSWQGQALLLFDDIFLERSSSLLLLSPLNDCLRPLEWLFVGYFYGA